MGMNNFIRFLKEYELLAESNNFIDMGFIILNKKGNTNVREEYQKVGINRAQIIFKHTTKSKNSKLNFEQFLYALKQVSVEVYPYSGASEHEFETLEKTVNEI